MLKRVRASKQKTRTKRKAFDKAFRIALVIFSSLVLLLGVTVWLYPRDGENPLCANSLSCATIKDAPMADNQGVYFGHAVQSPDIPNTESFAIANARTAVLGDSTATKHIYVDLTSQKLYAYEGNSLFMDVPIASGLYNPTPTGDFHIWVWLRATLMTGGDKAKGDYYYLPNVPYTMYFYNDQILKQWGYSLHGEYWYPYSQLGTPHSHGCVNMAIPDAQKLFYWSNPNIKGWTTYATADYQGPTITIYGTTPHS